LHNNVGTFLPSLRSSINRSFLRQGADIGTAVLIPSQ
jgi:hypothetical protein